MKFRNKEAGTQQQKNQTKVCKHARRSNLHYYNVSRDQSPQRENDMDSPSFKGFHAQLDCKLTHGNKPQGLHRPLLELVMISFPMR